MTKRRLVLFPWLVSMAFVFLSSPSGLATSLTGDERGEWAIEFSAKPVPQSAILFVRQYCRPFDRSNDP